MFFQAVLIYLILLMIHFTIFRLNLVFCSSLKPLPKRFPHNSLRLSDMSEPPSKKSSCCAHQAPWLHSVDMCLAHAESNTNTVTVEHMCTCQLSALCRNTSVHVAAETSSDESSMFSFQFSSSLRHVREHESSRCLHTVLLCPRGLITREINLRLWMNDLVPELFKQEAQFLPQWERQEWKYLRSSFL